MDWYSFFITDFGSACNYVYADSLVDNDLLGGIELPVSPIGDSSDNFEIILDFDTASERAETDENAEYSEEVSQENFTSDISQYDYIEPSLDGIVKKNFLEDLSLFSDKSQHVEEDGYVKEALTRGVWNNAFFGTTTWGNVEAGFYDYIGPAFNGWRYNYTLDWRSRIDLLTNATKNSVWATNARIDDTNYNVDRINSKLGTHTTNISNAFKRIANAEEKLTTYSGYIATLQSQSKSFDSSINSLKNRASVSEEKLSRYSGYIASNTSRIGTLEATFSGVSGTLTSILNKLNTINNNMVDGMKTTNGRLEILVEKMNTLNSNMYERMTSMIGRQDTTNAKLTDIFNKLNTVNNNMSGGIDTTNSTLETLVGKTNTINNNTFERLSLVISEQGKSNEKLTDIFNKLNTINNTFYDRITLMIGRQDTTNSKLNDVVGKLNTINNNNVIGHGATATTILDLKNSLNNLWQSKDYNETVVDGDGLAVKLFKYQIAILKNAIVDTLNSNQKNTQFLFDKYFGLEPGSAIYALRYTIIDGYTQTNELLQYIFDGVNLLGKGQTTTNGWLDLINQGIQDLKNTGAIITQWLKLIYDKNIIVNVPEFDYNLLQKMLDGLNFGNIVNEAGTNIWDFLSSLIDNLGDIISTGLTELGTITGKILDILDGLLDDIVNLIVPKNLDFLDDGFQGTSDKIKLKFSFLFNWVDTFKGLFGGQVAFEDINLSLGFFDGNVNLPLSVINDFAPLVKAVTTGFILLEFLIDMYKWFHTKGEVIE